MTREQAEAIVKELWAEAERNSIDDTGRKSYPYMVGALQVMVREELVKLEKPKKK
jgi:hypothetical protein